jgi:hypothetical protein
VQRHAEGNDLLLFAELVEINRVVALVAINNEQAVLSNSAPLCMLIKVLQPLQAKLICCPAVPRDCNTLIVRYTTLLVPGREVVLAGEDDKRWDSPPHYVTALNSCDPLPVALLYRLWSFSTVRCCDYRSSQYYAHHKASLIKVVHVFVLDAVLYFVFC